MKISIVDTFTMVPFSGNAAGVCLLDSPIPDSLKQKVAQELGFSETAFVQHQPDNTYHIRWFTPTVEVDLCGHATLAAAYVLSQQSSAPSFHFNSKSGPLSVSVNKSRLTLDFPTHSLVDIAENQALISALNLTPSECVNWSKVDSDNGFLIVEIASIERLKTVSPNFSELTAATPLALILTAAETPNAYGLRLFAPQYGINEDPVTGSAQCALAPYWHAKTGNTHFNVSQYSARYGELEVEYSPQRTYISGTCVLTGSTHLTI